MVLIAWAHRMPSRIVLLRKWRQSHVQQVMRGPATAVILLAMRLVVPRCQLPGDDLERSLLSDNFAVSDTLRDINDAGMGSLVAYWIQAHKPASQQEAARLPDAGNWRFGRTRANGGQRRRRVAYVTWKGPDRACSEGRHFDTGAHEHINMAPTQECVRRTSGACARNETVLYGKLKSRSHTYGIYVLVWKTLCIIFRDRFGCQF